MEHDYKHVSGCRKPGLTLPQESENGTLPRGPFCSQSSTDHLRREIFKFDSKKQLPRDKPLDSITYLPSHMLRVARRTWNRKKKSCSQAATMSRLYSKWWEKECRLYDVTTHRQRSARDGKKKKWPTFNHPRQLVAKTWFFFLQSAYALHPVVRFTL